MARQYYDDFSKLTLDKMPQSISDMTYQYKETHVPKKHYKEMLSKGYEEIVEARYDAYKIERDNGKNDAEISEIIGLSVRNLEGNHYHYRYNKEKRIDSKV